MNVALVTAAGYKGKPARYEQRLQGLLDGFRDAKVSEETLSRFFVMGGECNFLFRCNADYKLVEIAAEDFHTAEQREWSEDKIQQLLDLAEQSILSGGCWISSPAALPATRNRRLLHILVRGPHRHPANEVADAGVPQAPRGRHHPTR